jgi:hypothetical protein
MLLNLLFEARQKLEQANILFAEIDILKSQQLPTLLLNKSASFEWIEGILKLENRVQAEMQFLKKLVQFPENIKAAHVAGTNISHYRAIVDVIKSEKNVIQVLKAFRYKAPDGSMSSICIDVVSDFGKRWIKVIKLFLSF